MAGDDSKKNVMELLSEAAWLDLQAVEDLKAPLAISGTQEALKKVISANYKLRLAILRLHKRLAKIEEVLAE